MRMYHPTAKTTFNIRKEIKDNKDGLNIKEQTEKYNVCVNTIKKWRGRDCFEDAPHGAIKPKKSITDVEEHIICEIRKTTLLPLDDIYEIVKEFGIKITRSALHRALQRNGLSNLKKYIGSLSENEEKKHKEFKVYEEGFIHIDIKYLPKIDGKRTYLFVAIDRSTRLVFVDIFADKTAASANKFLEKAIEFFPFDIEKILTDNGKEFTDRFNNKTRKPTGEHVFDKTCRKNKIEHRLTKPYTPQTNGMVERVNGKVTQNVLNKIKFKGIDEMKKTIFSYFYNYNYYIKHSGIERLTPIKKLERIYLDRPERFNYTIEEFHSRNTKLFKPHIMGPDR